ncbi:ATP-binding cassette domain-containing protein [Carnobacterium sp. PL12RED10]|uniref:ABC transporter ATP-binding protein n=1 Tax=Carnobacterium sp. PL12RED10 TaxID=2592351 RepID=UPI0011F03908|nr:ABC transporter ATP-binding protein [Carnobacterium sp. PL12RED10]KAF3300508.1 ATP-binding cassette domain-containing protein [Carnobacterium sp. PL12RED10]
MDKTTFSWLMDYIKRYRWTTIGLFLFSTITVLFQVLIPIQIGQAVNEIVGLDQVDFKVLWQAIIWLGVFALIAALAQYLQNQMSNRLTYHIIADLHRDAFNKIQKLPLSYVDNHSLGDLVSRVINDVDLVGNGLLQSFNNLFSGVILIVGVIVMMLSLDVKIGLIVIILTPISVVVSYIIASRTYHRFTDQVNLRGELGGYVDEMAQGQMIVRAFTFEDDAIEQFTSINQKVHESGLWSQFYGALINPTSRVLNSIVYAVVGVVGAFTVLSGQLSVGIFSSFLTYANQYNKPFNDISSIINEMQTSLAAAARVHELMGAKEETPSRDQAEIASVEGAVDFKDLTFHYDSQRPLIEDLNIHIKAGDTVAIVGPTGAGKTTLINLLMRFYDPVAGGIHIDGVNTLDMQRNYLRQKFGMVLQDSWIFEGTIFDNIAYGKSGATMEEVVAVAKKAQIHDMIMQMDQDYQFKLSESGANISKGQQQLICIARIMLTDPDMLILDEATSSIDTMTEKAIQETFDAMMVNHTTFIVAHRLSTIENADQILYMENGHVLEQGSHQSLLEKEGKYFNLYQSQFDHQTE